MRAPYNLYKCDECEHKKGEHARQKSKMCHISGCKCTGYIRRLGECYNCRHFRKDHSFTTEECYRCDCKKFQVDRYGKKKVRINKRN